MVLADVRAAQQKGEANMNHYDTVTAFYSLRQSASKSFLMHHFIQIFEIS